MNARLLMLAIGLLGILSTGCISLDFTQNVARSGDSVLTESMDLSALLAAGSQYASMGGQLSEACDNITAADSTINCSYDSGVLTLSKPLKASDGQYIFNRTSQFPDVIYTLEVRKIPQVADPGSLGSGSSGVATDSDFKSQDAKLTSSTLKAAGASMTYSIYMPGKIISAENGKISRGEDGIEYAEYDVLDLMGEGEYMVVRSKELDLPLVAIAAGAGALLIGGIVVALVLLKVMRK